MPVVDTPITSHESRRISRSKARSGGPTQQVLERNPQSMKVKFSCTTNPPASGEAVVNFESPTAYNSRALVNTVVMGQNERVNVDQTGRWLAADCGSVRPLGK